MKKLFIVLFPFLLFPQTASSVSGVDVSNIASRSGVAISNVASFSGVAVSVTGYDADAQAWFDRMATQMPDTSKAHYSEYCECLKDSSVWSLDLEEWIAVDDEADSRLGIHGNFDLIEVGSMSFIAYTGWTSDGSSYHRTGLIPSTGGGSLYTLNNASMWIYSNTNSDNSSRDFGTADGTNTLRMVLRSSNTLTIVFHGASATRANTSSLGLHQFNRPSSAAQEVFVRGVDLGSSSQSSTNLPSTEVWLHTQNNNGSPVSISTRQIWNYGFGSAYTIDQHKKKNNCLNQLRTRLGLTAH